MTDRDLLERAAKAAGVDGFWVDAGLNTRTNSEPRIWQPLASDGDALRLAVKLRLALSFTDAVALCAPENGGFYADEQASDHGGDRAAATRRAIVRAAAEMASPLT